MLFRWDHSFFNNNKINALHLVCAIICPYIYIPYKLLVAYTGCNTIDSNDDMSKDDNMNTDSINSSTNSKTDISSRPDINNKIDTSSLDSNMLDTNISTTNKN